MGFNVKIIFRAYKKTLTNVHFEFLHFVKVFYQFVIYS